LNVNKNKKYNQFILNLLEQEIVTKNVTNIIKIMQDNKERKKKKFKNKNLVFL
jgi:hypothetical protein